MSFYLMLAVVLGIFLVFLLIVGSLYPGNGSDLLDYDPAGRAARKILAEDEDIHQMHELRAEQEELAQRRAQRRGEPG
jgi:hypothetical protein